ncbi:hypothetical protein [Methylobacterium terricola]|uniref:hypothetical protein n=1 Tax=Methylobacterium terricola TaxID=2583531 RepID=UPI001FEB9309|nr:hypothetical protein [Methylobacterium terricola]
MQRAAEYAGRRSRGRRPAIAGLALAGLVALGGAALAGEPLQAPLQVPLPAPLPPIRVLTLLVAVHLVGLSFGLGGATMLDFWILRWMRWGSLPGEIARIFLFVSKVVSVGLGLLWLSGLGFLAVYAVESPEKFDNPKLWAKIAVVLALTVNGLLIHAVVLPGVLRDLSRPMLDGVSGRRTAIFLISGAVSGVSWYAAFALGLMRELNGRVPASLLLALWLAAVMAAALAAYIYWLHLREWTLRHAARDAAEPQPESPPEPAPAREPGNTAAPAPNLPAARAPARPDAAEIRSPAAPARIPSDRIPSDRILALTPARARPGRRA